MSRRTRCEPRGTTGASWRIPETSLEFRTKKWAGANARPGEGRNRSSGNGREGSAGRLVETDLHQLQTGVVVVPEVVEQLGDVEDPHVAELKVPRVADAGVVHVDATGRT